ncbi:MAG: TetR family transcriptional regulator C-terminal domain-containing protein [bacterium]
MPPGRKSIAKQRRAEICDAFLRCARREGLYRASNRKIAREAGISLSMLHHYFKSREEMIEEFVQTKMLEEFYATLFSQDIWQDHIEDRLPKMVDFAFSESVVNGETVNVYFDLLGEAKRNERLRRIVADMWQDLREKTAEWLMSSNGIGLSRKEARTVATLMAAMYEGISVMWNMDPTLPLDSLSRFLRDIFETYFREKTRRRRPAGGAAKPRRRSRALEKRTGS